MLDGDLQHIGQPIDLLGVNYYMPYLVKAGAGHKYHNTGYVGAGDVDFVPAGRPTTARGWEIDPDGLYDLLMRLSRDYQAPPLWITENGAAYHDRPDSDGAVHDPDRIAYLDSHFRAAHRAIQRRRRPTRLLHLDAPRQLRVVLRRVEPLRPRACGL